MSIAYQTGQVLLTFHVPVPPLQFKQVFVIQALTMVENYGFSLSLGGTELTITAVTLLSATSGTTILITFNDTAYMPPLVSYADKANTGSGNVCDSDPAMALDNWLFTAGSGQYLTENFPGPVTGMQIVSNNQPYKLWNFLCPFTLVPSVAV